MELILQASIARAEARFQTDLGRNILVLANDLIDKATVTCLPADPHFDVASSENGTSPQGHDCSSCECSPQSKMDPPATSRIRLDDVDDQMDQDDKLEGRHSHELLEFISQTKDLSPTADATAFIDWASHIDPFVSRRRGSVVAAPQSQSLPFIPSSHMTCALDICEAIFQVHVREVVEERIQNRLLFH